VSGERVGARFWITAAAGWVVIAVGLRGIVQHRIDTRPGELARFVIGGALVHDLVLAPLVLVAGLAVARLVPGRLRAPVQVGAVISAIVALFAYPVVRAFGLASGNPTSLPHDYATNLVVVLVAVWLVVGLVVAVGHGRRRYGAALSDDPATEDPHGRTDRADR
jgi:hypothetical protein